MSNPNNHPEQFGYYFKFDNGVEFFTRDHKKAAEIQDHMEVDSDGIALFDHPQELTGHRLARLHHYEAEHERMCETMAKERAGRIASDTSTREEICTLEEEIRQLKGQLAISHSRLADCQAQAQKYIHSHELLNQLKGIVEETLNGRP